MAKGDETVREVVKVITSKASDEKIAALVQEEKGEFPDVSSIELQEPYVDAFKPPDWCDTENYSYAWLDPNDEVQLDRALHTDYWSLVTRSNHVRGRASDFRSHGAVERRGMVLAYRPIDLDRRLRFLGVQRHHDMMSSQEEGKRGDKWETSMQVGTDIPSTGFKPVVGEVAGKPGELVDKSSGID